MASIIVEGVSKQFDTVQALDQISFEVEKGSLFGLIGPDGAGKSTLFSILTSLLIPDEGSAHVEGLHTVRDYKKIRKIIGYMPGRFSLYPDLSVEENLRFFATIFRTSIEENYHLIKEIYVQLEPFRKRRAGKLSGGMKQKLALCCALIHQPEVLFLDEPTTGVDAVSRAEFWEMLRRLKAFGITILVSTPYMDEASQCERIALIQEGKIMGIDTPQGIRDSFENPLYALRTQEVYPLLQALRSADFVKRVEPFGEFLHLTLEEETPEPEITDWLRTAGFPEVEVEKIRAGIEDVFLSLMN